MDIKVRHLPPAQRIAVWDKFRRIVEGDNAKRKSDKISLSNKNRKFSDVQSDNNEKGKTLSDKKSIRIKNLLKFAQARTRDTVASKLGIGSGKQYEKEKYIVENQQSLTANHFILKNPTVANLRFLK